MARSARQRSRQRDVVEHAIPVPISIEEGSIENPDAALACPLCFSVLEPRPVDLRLPETDPILEGTSPIPGFYCPSCGAEYLPSETSHSIYRQASPRLQEIEKQAASLRLRQRIRDFRRAITKSDRLS